MLNQLKKLGRGIIGLFSNEMGAIYRNKLMVQDLKARYVKGCDSVVNLNNQRIEIQAQKKISLEELDKIEDQLKVVVRDLKAVDTKNQASWSNFNVLKAKYESLKNRKESLEATIKQYDTVLDNLNKLIARTKSECEKLKAKYTEVEFNVQTYKNMKRINDVIAVTTDELAETNIDIEQVNDDLRMEIAKFNVRAEDAANEEKTTEEFVTNPDEMQNFINSL
jgi:uncharacterized coiled-coil protein SlyX